MSDPKRLLESGDSEATPLERALLRSARDPQPPESERAAVWAAVMAQVGAGGGGGSDGASGGSGGVGAVGASGSGALAGAGIAGAAYLVKLGALAALAGSAVGYFSYIVVSPPTGSGVTRSPAPLPFVESAPRAAAPAPIALEPAAVTSSSAAPSPPRANPATATGSESSSSLTSRLREESALLSSARESLRTGDPNRALTVLETARTRFPDGVLLQERKALEIEALWKSGQKDAAAAQADAFLETWPKSTLAARVRSFRGP